MKSELKAPSVGESITEVVISRWMKQDGEAVAIGDPLLEVESEKASLEIVAESNGVLQITRQPGETVKIGETLGYIDDAAKPSAAKPAAPAQPATPPKAAAAAPVAAGAQPMAGPAARKMAADQGVDIGTVAGTGRDGRVTKGDLLEHQEKPKAAPAPAAKAAQPATAAPAAAKAIDERTRRVPMTLLRRKIAERLVNAQQTAAILTTFNEVDMTAVSELRKKNKDSFKAKYGVGLGFMSFFTKAVAEALKVHPIVNAFIDAGEVVYHDYQDIGIAVGTERGLVVPILRNVGDMNLAQIETEIARLAGKARDGKLTVQDMSGGTFTISNGGVYGSLLSTPILTPPQSGILGMHKIQDRPVALNGQVVIRPMMYLAVSYDHRLLDGKDAVLFLVAIKQFLEQPETMGVQF